MTAGSKSAHPVIMGEAMRRATIETSVPYLHPLAIETDGRNWHPAHLRDRVDVTTQLHLLARPGKCFSPRLVRGHRDIRPRILTMGD